MSRRHMGFVSTNCLGPSTCSRMHQTCRICSTLKNLQRLCATPVHGSIHHQAHSGWARCGICLHCTSFCLHFTRGPIYLSGLCLGVVVIDSVPVHDLSHVKARMRQNHYKAYISTCTCTCSGGALHAARHATAEQFIPDCHALQLAPCRLTFHRASMYSRMRCWYLAVQRCIFDAFIRLRSLCVQSLHACCHSRKMVVVAQPHTHNHHTSTSIRQCSHLR